MNTYGHLMPSVYAQGVEALDSIFEKPKLKIVS